MPTYADTSPAASGRRGPPLTVVADGPRDPLADRTQLSGLRCRERVEDEATHDLQSSMDLVVTGKRAFVSGSTQGIGYAVARALAEEGVRVVLNGRTAAGVDAAVESLRAAVPGADVSGIPADFADPEQVRALLASLGEVDILVNNVGIFEIAPFEQISDEDWQRYFDVNLMSGVRLSRHALPGMLERGWGRIIFVSSKSGVDVLRT
jgi:NADP-dependent 3-hydroxy acid dehydrogenase YdfG